MFVRARPCPPPSHSRSNAVSSGKFLPRSLRSGGDLGAALVIEIDRNLCANLISNTSQRYPIGRAIVIFPSRYLSPPNSFTNANTSYQR